MLQPILCDYSDAYILVSGNIEITGAVDNDAAKQADERSKEVIFKNFAPFTHSISEISNTQAGKAKDIDFSIPMHKLIEYSNKKQENFGNSDEPNCNIIESESLKFTMLVLLTFKPILFYQSH